MLRAAQFPLLLSCIVAAMLSSVAASIGGGQGVQTPATAPSTPKADRTATLSVRLAEPAGPRTWLELTPLLSQAEARFASFPDGKRQLDLPDIPAGPLLVCTGAAGGATECTKWLGGGGALTATVVPGVRVVGRCVRDEKPVAGARVSLVPARLTARRPFTVPLYRDGERLVRYVTSGADGRFVLPQVSPGEFLLQVIPPGGRIQSGQPFLVPRAESLRRDQAGSGVPQVDLGDFLVEGGAKVDVIVTDNVGTPLAGATVSGGQGTLPNVTFFEAAADDEGRATLSGFDPLSSVRVTCQKQGFTPLQQSFASLPATVVCALDPLAAITGSVTNSDGEPISGATALLRSTSRSVRSDKRGTFTLTDVAPGIWEVVIASPGFDAAKRSVEVRPGETRELGQIELAPGSELHGLVRDARSGAPVPNALVVCESPPGLGQTATGLDGTFSLSLQKLEPSVLAVSADGYPTARRTVGADQLGSEHPLVIDLGEGGRIHVSAWDDETDAPCAGCSIAIAASGSNAGSIITDANGEAQSSPLAPGPYWVGLEKVRSVGAVVRVSGGDAQRWVDVKPGATTPVQLGSPLVQVKVRLTAAPSPEWQLLGVRLSGFSVGEPLGNNVYQLKFRRGETMRLRLHSPVGSSVAVGALPADFEGTAADFELPQTGVHGQLTAKDVGAAGQHLDILRYNDSQLAATVVTMTEGFFACPYLPGGMYVVAANQKVLGTFALGNQQQLELGLLQLPTP